MNNPQEKVLLPSEKEAARLAALAGYDILDTSPEQGFDDIVFVATQICEAPVALVSLVASDRQWFKARVGTDLCETPLSQSVCALTLGRPGVLIIPDLTADPRTRGNTLVRGPPYARFYAGARLETPDGQALGALCVIDTKVRPEGLTPPQQSALEALARQVMTQLDLRRSMTTLEKRVTERAEHRSRTWQVSPFMMGVLNTEGFFESSNPAWQQILGWSEAEISNRKFFDFLHPDDLLKSHVPWKEAFAGQPVLNFENRCRRSDGTYRWLSWRAVPEGDKIYCTARDITSRKELESANEASNAMLLSERAASALREQFIAVLSHDLRNPLAAISGAMHLLLRTPLNERAKTLVDMTQGSVLRMASLIENVMDFARGRLGGGLILNRKAASLEPVLRQIVDELLTGMPGRTIEAEFALHAPVNCDPIRVGQLVSNLLGNALTHGASDAPIRLAAKTAHDWFELSVANNGKPIPAEMLNTIFEPFARGESHGSLQGLGLGLYISHEIATAHGGMLDVESTPVETRFTFRMPLTNSRQ